MQSTSELTRRLADLIRARNATTFYLNGPPGSGKSHLLNELATQLPADNPRSLALGPYSVSRGEVNSLQEHIVRDCRDAGFLDGSSLLQPGLDLASTWQWLAENAHVPDGQTFLVLVDLIEGNPLISAPVSSLFSNARYLEGAWSDYKVRIHHMFAGYWDQPALENYYREINTSFPYTVGYNYATWSGLCQEEMVALLSQARPREGYSIHGRLLFELTGGHPAAAMEILESVAPGDLNLPALLTSTYRAAENGATGQSLLGVWCQLPDKARDVLQKLILNGHIEARVPHSTIDQLLTAGIVRLDQVGTEAYLSFRSWYAELLVRLHTEALEIASDQTQKIRLAELMPSVSELSIEAYRLINDIENAARNFVTVQLCLQHTGEGHILKDKHKKYDNQTGGFEDAFQRAQEWRDRRADGGLAVGLNPLLAYCSTRDLAGLIEEIGAKMDSEAWQRIARAIRGLADIRDAVMHNQIVDDLALQQLYALQGDIYQALSQPD